MLFQSTTQLSPAESNMKLASPWRGRHRGFLRGDANTNNALPIEWTEVPMSDTSHHATRTPAGPVGRFFEDAVSKTRFWWLLLVTGVAWVIVSMVILRFDYTTVAAIAVLFGVYCLAAGANQIIVGAVSTSTGWRIWHWLLAIVFVVVGVVSFMNFAATFVTLAAIISFYFVFRGVFDIAMALAGSRAPGWWVLVVAGLVELGLGFWSAGSWHVSVVVLVAWVAAGALIHGIGEIALAFQVQHGRRGVEAVQAMGDRLGVTTTHPAAGQAVPSR
jgi:uncharacterized membrane protein HdeD (DUF308 family)